MMENRKKTGLFIIITAIVLLVIIIIVLLKLKTDEPLKPAPVTNDNGTNILVESGSVTPTTTPSDRPRNPQNYDASKEAPYIVDESDAVKKASLFTTRFGSFSNQSDYGNMTDLKIYMTASMRSWVDTYVAKLKAEPYDGTYYGIITKALTTNVISYDDKNNTAKIEVTTERQETKADQAGAPYQQKMVIDLVKVNNDWLIDSAVWQK